MIRKKASSRVKRKAVRSSEASAALSDSQAPSARALVQFCAAVGIDLFSDEPLVRLAAIDAAGDNLSPGERIRDRVVLYEKYRKELLSGVLDGSMEEKLREGLICWTKVHAVAERVINDTPTPKRLRSEKRLDFKWRRSNDKSISTELATDAELAWDEELLGPRITAAQALQLIDRSAPNLQRYKTEEGMVEALISFGFPMQKTRAVDDDKTSARSAKMAASARRRLEGSVLTEAAVKTFVRLRRQWEQFGNAMSHRDKRQRKKSKN